MAGKIQLLVLTVSIAAVATWLVAPNHGSVVHATAVDPLADSDGDFLPDCVEWAVMTSSTNPDTDGDGITDFVEVVQRGTPRQANNPMPLDQEMRIVVTAPPAGSPDQTVWMHVLLRFVGSVAVTNFRTWLTVPSLPGVEVPLDILSLAGVVVRQRLTPEDGLWFHVAVPLVSTSVIQPFLPCSLHAEADIGGRNLHVATMLIDMQGTVSTLVPFGEHRFAVQSIAAPVANLSCSSNRVCVMQCEEVGSGPGGTVLQVMHADCEDCNEMECSSSCPQSVGWLMVVPNSGE